MTTERELQLRPEVYLVSDTYREWNLITVGNSETYIYLNGTLDSYSKVSLVKKTGKYWNVVIKTPAGMEMHWIMLMI